MVAGSVPASTRPASTPVRRPSSRKSRPTSNNVPRSGAPGMIVNTGMWAVRAVAIADSTADIIVLSPPMKSACAPREASDCTASTMPEEFSTVASRRVSPSTPQASRAFRVKASEFDSAGFHAIPTTLSDGSERRASANASSTGRNEPRPTMCGGCCRGLAAIQADAGAERIGHEPEHVTRAAGMVRVGHGLHRRRARRDHEVELAGRDLSRDRVTGREIPLRVVPAQRHPIAVPEPELREAVDHAAHAGVEHRRRGVLHDRDAQHAAARGVRDAAVAIRHQQHEGREADQGETERETFEGVPDLHERVPEPAGHHA